MGFDKYLSVILYIFYQHVMTLQFDFDQ